MDETESRSFLLALVKVEMSGIIFDAPRAVDDEDVDGTSRTERCAILAAGLTHPCTYTRVPAIQETTSSRRNGHDGTRGRVVVEAAMVKE